MKLSLRMGTTLVPCYAFGNTRVFRSWNDPYGILRCGGGGDGLTHQAVLE